MVAVLVMGRDGLVKEVMKISFFLKKNLKKKYKFVSGCPSWHGTYRTGIEKTSTVSPMSRRATGKKFTFFFEIFFEEKRDLKVR